MKRSIRAVPLSAAERERLYANATYEGAPSTSEIQGTSGLPRRRRRDPDKTLCDEAAVFNKGAARVLLAKAIEGGIVSGW